MDVNFENRKHFIRTDTIQTTMNDNNQMEIKTVGVNIPEKRYISILNEFEKSCIPLFDLNQKAINTAVENFINACRAFGMDSTASKLRYTIQTFENLEKCYAIIINTTHRQYRPESRRIVTRTTPAIFQSLGNGIKLLRVFHDFCGTYEIIDKETVKVFMDLTKGNGCSTMAVYVELKFFESMSELCRDFGKTNIPNEDICSTTVKYRSVKERIDNINKKDISKSYIDIKNFLDTWHEFLAKVVVFIMKNYLRLRDKKSSLCFQVFLDQQYQIAAEYFQQYKSFELSTNANKQKEKMGLIWT